MENIRSDYKIDRNKKMYEEYVTTDISFNKLATKYGLSPQRVRFVINDLKNKGLAQKLDKKSGKKAREKYKNTAIELRESGKHAIALKMFEEVIALDESQGNTKGLIDVLGHKKITLVSMAEKTSSIEKKKELMAQAAAAVKKALEIGKNDKKIKPGTIAIQKIHYASLITDEALLLPSGKKKEKLETAVKVLSESLKALSGSEAHKAWPLGNKAKAQYLLGDIDGAFETLQTAQKALYDGYEEEIKNKDQGRLKLRVWNSGIMLGYAMIHASQEQPLLAEVYASAVINTPDPDGVLSNRKKQAKDILENL